MSGARRAEPQVALSSSAMVVVRGDSAIQFGVNSGTAGIFPLTTGNPKNLVRVFATCRHPVTLPVLQHKLMTAGLDETTTSLLIDDLLNHGVLIPSERLVVGLIGRSSLAQTIIRLLSELGIIVLQPQPTTSQVAFIEQLPFDTPVIVAGKLELIRNLVLVLHSWPELLPVTLVDANGVIGPVRTRGHGPCLQCFDLYHMQRDPEWRNIMAQVPLNPRPNPVVEYATAARLAALLSPRYPAPGVTNTGLQPGLVIELNPFTGDSQESIMQPHPICPMCWDS